MDARSHDSARAAADFEAAVGAVIDRLARTAFLLAGDHEVAEDLLHRAVYRGYRRWRWLRSGQSPEACVRTVLVRSVAGGRNPLRLHRLLEPDAGPQQAQIPLPRGMTELQGILVRGLLGLPPRVRAALVLRYWEQLPEEVAAHELGWSPEAVRKRAETGLSQLHRLALDDAPPRPVRGRRRASRPATIRPVHAGTGR